MDPLNITGSGSGFGSGRAQLSGPQALELIQSADAESRIRAAQEIRRLTKTSHRCRRQLAAAVGPLVAMLKVHDSPESSESALLALLNLAVRDERNKTSILAAGGLEPITSFLRSSNPTLQEHAATTLLTLSASPTTKPTISSSTPTIPLLVKTLKTGTPQAKADSIMALHNLATHPETLKLILNANPIPSTLALLKSCKKSSKTAEKCTSLISALAHFHQGRAALASEEGGLLALVEALERGSSRTRENVVGALLTMCESERSEYREPILKEGVIPGLLELTVKGTPKARSKAKILLRMLRDPSCGSRSVDAIEDMVCNIVSRMEGGDQPGEAKKMLAEMVQVSMEQSLRHLQQRALVRTNPF